MELSSKQYYVHNSFINIYYYLYVALENWISKNIFRGDLSRVFLSSDEYVFRRRFELTDMSKVFEETELSSLQFPFANYWPLNSGWKPDQRLAATNAALIYRGIYEGNTRIKAIPSILEFPTTFYFSREDDARMAYDILYFKSFNEHYYTQDMPYANSTLTIPVNISIDDIEFNSKYRETDWLKDNRIFTISAIFKLRSFTIEPPNQPKYDEDDSISYDDGFPRYPLTEEVLLKCRNYNDLLTSILPVTYNDIPYFGQDIKIESWGAKPIDNSRAKLFWLEGDNNKDPIVKISLSINNFITSKNLNLKTSEYIVNDLTPGSSYYFYLTFYTKSGKSKKLSKEYYHPNNKENLLEQKTPTNALVGLSW